MLLQSGVVFGYGVHSAMSSTGHICYNVLFKSRLFRLKCKSRHFSAPAIFALLFNFSPTTGHGMVVDESDGLGCSVTGFSLAGLRRETFLACCGAPHVIHLCADFVCMCDVGIVLHKRRDVKCV